MSFSKQLYSLYSRYSGFILFGFVCFQVYFGIIPGWTEIRSDFPNYYVSSKLIFEEKDSLHLYDNDWFQSQIISHSIESKGKFAPFPPPTAFLLAPLSGFSPLTAKRIWLFINLGFIFLIVSFIQKISSLSYRSSWVLLLCTGVAAANTLMLGQMYFLLLLSMLWAYQLFKLNKDTKAGIIIGTGIAIKYFPFVFIPSLLLERRWKSIGIISLSILLINFLACSIFGWRTYVDFFETVFFQHLNGNLEGQSPWSHAFQSWNALSYNLFRYHEIENPSPFIVSDNFFYIFKYGVQLLILSFSVWVLYRLRKSSIFFEASVIMCSLTVLYLTPAGATYHSLLLLLPISLFLSLMHSNNKAFDKTWILVIVCITLSGVLPLLQNRIELFDKNFLFSFHRLWLLSAIYFAMSLSLLNFQKENVKST